MTLGSTFQATDYSEVLGSPALTLSTEAPTESPLSTLKGASDSTLSPPFAALMDSEALVAPVVATFEAPEALVAT